MSQQIDFKDIIRRLNVRASELKALLEQQSDSSAAVELDQSRVGRLSRMDALQQQAMAQAAQRRTLEELLRTEAALRKIEDGTFGICVSCEEEIEANRLRASPSTLICLKCAQAKEKSR